MAQDRPAEKYRGHFDREDHIEPDGIKPGIKPSVLGKVRGHRGTEDDKLRDRPNQENSSNRGDRVKPHLPSAWDSRQSPPVHRVGAEPGTDDCADRSAPEPKPRIRTARPQDSASLAHSSSSPIFAGKSLSFAARASALAWLVCSRRKSRRNTC